MYTCRLFKILCNKLRKFWRDCFDRSLPIENEISTGQNPLNLEVGRENSIIDQMVQLTSYFLGHCFIWMCYAEGQDSAQPFLATY